MPHQTLLIYQTVRGQAALFCAQDLRLAEIKAVLHPAVGVT
jgi:hypothetical protein